MSEFNTPENDPPHHLPVGEHTEGFLETPVPIPPLPADATPEQKDLHWYRHVYQGDRMPQLTWRAVIMGGFLGMLMSAANLYTTLSIGWAFGIAITASVLSFVIWNMVRLTAGKHVSQMSVLENACMASCASAAGYSTGSTIATMFGALVLLKEVPAGVPLSSIKTWDVTPPWVVVVFTLCTGLMGVFLAIPMKRQQINHEQLPFPSGIAAAETLRSLYSASKDAVKKAYVLVIGLASGLLIGFLRAGDDVLDAVGFLKRLFDKISALRIPGQLELNFVNRLYPGGRHPVGFAFEPSALLIAAGMIVGMRTSLTMLISSLLLYVAVAPNLAKHDVQHMEQRVLVVQAAGNAVPLTDDYSTVGLQSVEAVAAAAAADGIDPEPVRAAAERARDAAVRAAETDSAKPDFSAQKAAEDVQKAVVKAAVPVASQADYKPNFIFNWGTGEITITRWSLWGGTACMVFASLMSVAMQWRTIVRAFMGVKGGAPGSTNEEAARMKEIEVPGIWMVIGMVPITIAMVWLQIQAFGVTWYAGIIAVAMSFVLSLVATRATGETDTTPIGAMGKVMQLLFAVLAPNNVNANLASAGIAANSASSSADLLTDLKAGYLLGANPRRQFLAQFYGVFFGTVAIVPIWYLMVPDRAKLESFALPATRAWEAVAKVLVKGVGELPPSAVWAIFIGAGVGIVLPLIERFMPANARKYMPSVTALGLAWVIPFQNAFSFFIGACIAWAWLKAHRKSAEAYNVPLASGLVAGESLMAAGLAIIATAVGLLK